jgi:mono/diheme cytochrome c family protein
MQLVRMLLVCSISFATVLGAQSQQPSPKDRRKDFDYTELAKAPEKQRRKSNPLANDPEAVVAGKVLFAEHCGECHGDDAEGTKRAPSLRAQEVQDAAPGAIFWILSNGIVRKRMPVWSKLPEPQRWQLVSFIKSLKSASASESSPAAASKN